MNKLQTIFALTAIFLLSGMFSAQAQENSKSDYQKYYIRLGGGWSFGAGRTSVGTNYIETSYMEYYGHDDPRETVNRHSIEESPAKLSFGKGADVMLGFGYMFNKYIGIDVSLAGVFAGKTSVVNEISRTDVRDVSSSYLQEHTTSSSTTSQVEDFGYTGLYLIPALRVAMPIGRKFSAYSRIGIAMPLMSTGYRSVTSTESSSETGWRETSYGGRESVNNSSADTDFIKSRIKSYFTVGMNAALGASFSLTKNLSLYAEVESMILSFTMKEETIVTATSNGENVLDSIPVEDRTVQYAKKLSYDTEYPTKELAETFSASSVGINVGLIISF